MLLEFGKVDRVLDCDGSLDFTLADSYYGHRVRVILYSSFLYTRHTGRFDNKKNYCLGKNWTFLTSYFLAPWKDLHSSRLKNCCLHVSTARSGLYTVKLPECLYLVEGQHLVNLHQGFTELSGENYYCYYCIHVSCANVVKLMKNFILSLFVICLFSVSVSSDPSQICNQNVEHIIIIGRAGAGRDIL